MVIGSGCRFRHSVRVMLCEEAFLAGGGGVICLVTKLHSDQAG